MKINPGAILKNYQIIATLGPAVEDRIPELIAAGATAFRLNCAHLSLEKLQSWLEKLNLIYEQQGQVLLVWLDLQGPKLRIGELTRPIHLDRGEQITFNKNESQTGPEIPLPHPRVFSSIQPGAPILLDDGRIELIVRQISGDTFSAEVMVGGELKSHKGFVIQNREPELTQISPCEQMFFAKTRSWSFVGYAISYLRYARELQIYRNATNHPLVAKIERPEAFAELTQLAQIADGTWLCRGDLGVSAPLFDLHRFEIKYLTELNGQPLILAGQVLENMVLRNYPARSEVAHLGYLIENGFSGVVLSDETAVGNYPVAAVKFCRDFFDYQERVQP